MKTKLFIIALLCLWSTPCFAETYWISPTGAAANLAACSGSTPLSGAQACSYDKANGAGVIAGDIVYYRAGTYSVASGSIIAPANSGSSGNPITFAAYPGEQVNFVGTATDSSVRGISIVNNDWIKVTGHDGSTTNRKMKFSNMAYFLLIWDGQSGSSGDSSPGAGSNYNEISYIEFTQTNPEWISGNYAAEASKLMHNSTYNWVHHCTFSQMGGCTASSDISASLNLGWEDCGLYAGNTCIDNTHDNVIEDNIMWGGGHQTIGIFNYNNVVRNNILHNERWFLGGDSIRHGYRVITTQSSYNTDYHHSYNLIEGNRISHSSENMIASNLGGTGIHLSISYTIIRQNDWYANNGNTFYIEVHDKTYGRTNYNHIYNNTFFANGYGATTPLGKSTSRSDPPDRSTFYFVASEAQFPNIQVGNVLKNNLSWKDYATSHADYWTVRSYDSTDGWKDMTSATCGGVICGSTIISNNWLHIDGDPKFTTEGSYGSPTVGNASYDWYWTTPDGTDVTTVNTEPTFTLQSSSPAINTGTWMTQADNAGANSTALSVDDASYFQPGWGKWASGGPSIAADYICFSSSSTATDLARCVQISSIDYTNNDITLASNMTWSDNDYIWLYKNSSGTVVLAGTAPDAGAHEYGAGSTPPSATGCTINGGTFK